MASKSKGFTVEPLVAHPWRKRLLTGVLVLVAAGTLSAGGYWWWLHTPPAMPDTAEEAHAMLRSARFRALAPERQADYLQRVRDLIMQLPEDQRRAVMREFFRDEEIRSTMFEAMREQMVQRARQFAAADKAEQQRMVNEMIGQMESMRGMFRGGGGGWRGGGGPGAGGPAAGGSGEAEGPPRRGPSEEELANMTETERQALEEERQRQREERQQAMMTRMTEEAATGNPQDRELIGGMMRAVRQEMERRGMAMPGRGGPRRGG